MKLKIKDDVDLKELEKFGFTEVTENMAYHYYRGHKYVINRILNGIEIYEVYINKDNFIRIIVNNECIIAGSLQVLIFDLIQAGLVEKVEG